MKVIDDKRWYRRIKVHSHKNAIDEYYLRLIDLENTEKYRFEVELFLTKEGEDTILLETVGYTNYTASSKAFTRISRELNNRLLKSKLAGSR